MTSFCDPLPPKELASLMHAADAFLMTSQFEGMPTVVLEAQACGLPVVSCPVGEVPAIIRPGISGEIASRDAGALADALVNALSRRSPVIPGQCAQTVQDFSADKVVGDFYSDIISACC